MSDPWIGIKCDWHQQPKSAALKNAVRLVEASRLAGFPPSEAATGRWLSVCLFWDGGRTDVEVFGDQFKLYFLPRSAEDGTFDVTHHHASAPDTIAVLIEGIRMALADIPD